MKAILALVLLSLGVSRAFATEYFCASAGQKLQGAPYTTLEARASIDQPSGIFYFSVTEKTLPPFDSREWTLDMRTPLAYESGSLQPDGKIHLQTTFHASEMNLGTDYFLDMDADGSTVFRRVNCYDNGERGPDIGCDQTFYRLQCHPNL